MYRPSDIARGIEDAVIRVAKSTKVVVNHATSSLRTKYQARRDLALARKVDDMARLIASSPELRARHKAALFADHDPHFVQAASKAAKRLRPSAR